MTAEDLAETAHMEAWIKQHSEVIDDTLMVVTTQFSSWVAESGKASERPDVLALASSGELVVIELKRDKDRRIHLQAITYGALVAGFTKETLAEAHAQWLTKESGEKHTAEQALQRLEGHVEAELDEDLFGLPRLVLVAEDFPAQVLTTVQWLAGVAPNLTIECHEYQLFRQGDVLLASFQRLYPVEDLEDRRLRPIVAAGTNEVREQLATRKRRAKSVKIIYDHDLIPEGAAMTLNLESLAKHDVVETVADWLAKDPRRAEFTWSPDPTRPLRWAIEPDRTWTPSSLRNEVFERAGASAPSFSAADAWRYNGTNLYWLANAVSDDE